MQLKTISYCNSYLYKASKGNPSRCCYSQVKVKIVDSLVIVAKLLEVLNHDIIELIVRVLFVNIVDEALFKG